MQVYKAYFKIIKKRLPIILMYFGVFVGVSMLITSMIGPRGTAAFAQSKSNIAFFNNDGGTPLAEGLKKYLANNAVFTDVRDDQQSIEDALFGENISYVLRIPAGFTQSFLSGSHAVSLQKTAASTSTSGVYMDLMVERYLNMAQLYLKNAPGMTEAQIVENVTRDLSNQADAVVKTYGNVADTNYLTYYFQYLAYCILAVMIMGVTSFMMAFNDTDLTNRNACSPLKPMNMNLQIVLGNITFAAVVWVAMCAVVFVIYGKMPLNAGTALFCLNALTMVVVGLSFGFLAGKFVRNPGVQSAVANVVSLGISFISGVFVPQELLGKTVLDISRFLPGYWYVKAVQDIKNIVVFNIESMLPVFYSMLIQLGFAAMVFIVALVLSKQIKLQREI